MIMYSSCEMCDNGPWKVVLWTSPPDPKLPDGIWYIHNTKTNSFRKVGRVGAKRVNFYDKAHEIAHQLNKKMKG